MSEEKIILDVDVRGSEDIDKLQADFRKLDQEIDKVDFEGLQAEADKANKAIKETAKVTDDSTRSMKSVRKEIKDLKDQLLNLEQGTEDYNRILQEVANKTLEIKDLNGAVAVSALDLGGKLENVVKVAGGVASAFNVAQAAQALFGNESEELQAVMVKLQAGIALVQGLQGLEGLTKSIPALVSSFKNFGNEAQATDTALKAVNTSTTAGAGANAAYGASSIALSTKVNAESAVILNNTKEVLKNTEAKLVNTEELLKAVAKQSNAYQELLGIQGQMTDINLDLTLSEGEKKAAIEEVGEAYKKAQTDLSDANTEVKKAFEKLHPEMRELTDTTEESIEKVNSLGQSQKAQTRTTEASTQATKTDTVVTNAGAKSKGVLSKATVGSTIATNASTLATKAGTVAQIAYTKATHLVKIALNGLKSALGPIALAFVAFEGLMWGISKVTDWWNKDTKRAEENQKKLEEQVARTREAMEAYNSAISDTLGFEKELNKLRGKTELEALKIQYESLTNEMLELNKAFTSSKELTDNERISIESKIAVLQDLRKETQLLIDKEQQRDKARAEGEAKEKARRANEEAAKKAAEANKNKRPKPDEAGKSLSGDTTLVKDSAVYKAREDALKKHGDALKRLRTEILSSEESDRLTKEANDAAEFSKMSDNEIRAYILKKNGNDKLKKLGQDLTEAEKKNNQEQAEDAEATAYFKEALAYNTADTLGNLSSLFEEHTIASKGMESAAVAISAAAGAAKCIAASVEAGPWGLAAGIAAAASVGAAAASSIKQIWAVDPKNGVQDVNIEQPNVNAIVKPTIKPVQNVLTNTELDLQAKGQRVYVVESDIQGVGQRVKMAESASTF